MANYTKVDERVESKAERRVRYFLAVLFFLQTALTSVPYVQGPVEIDGKEVFMTRTALNFLINPGGYSNQGAIPLAVIGAILVIFPIVAFFFCVLDSKSKVKFIISGACSVACAVVITFSFPGMLSFGAMATLILNVIELFMTAQGFQATVMRVREQRKNNL